MVQCIWHLDSGNVGGWQEIILNKYRPLFNNGLPSFNCHLSPTWRAIHSSFSSARLSATLNSSVCFKPGNGRTTRFWEDCWCGIAPLKSQFPRLYSLSTQQQAIVYAVFCPTNNCFKLSWSRDLMNRESDLCKYLMLVIKFVYQD
jgi:hypothetical protein